MGSPADMRKGEPTHPWVASVRNATYKRIATGTWFLLGGTILLLNTLDRLSWGVWIDLARLWPLLIISLGIRWTFVRTPFHPLVLLGPLLVIGATGYVVRGALSNQGQASIRRGAGEAEKTFAIACPPAGKTAPRLDITFDAGRLRLVSGGGDAKEGIAGSIRYAGDEPTGICTGPRLRLRGREDRLDHVRLLTPLGSGAKRWEAALSTSERLAFEARLTGAGADLDLTGFKLSDIALSASAVDVALRLGPPEGTVRVDLSGGFSSIRIVVPEGTCWTLARRRRTSFLRIDGERPAGARQITAPACARTKDAPRYAFDIDLPLASVRLDTTGG